MGVTLDTSQLERGIKRLELVMDNAQWSGVLDVSNEILRLSQSEVPHDVGTLQNSGHVEPHPKSHALVGYNTPYAARLHEHPEYNFQKGRKGKYLEDPIKRNLSVFKRYMQDNINQALR